MNKTRSMQSTQDARAALLAAALERAGEEGWTASMLSRAAGDAGIERARLRLICVGGIGGLMVHFCADGDERMRKALDKPGFADQSVRDSIAAGVRTRLELDGEHKAAVKELVKALAMPLNAALALRCLMATSDAIWRAAGDTAKGMSFYTKRASLSGVYATTLIYWLGDRSPNHEKSWRFLDNRLNDVLKIGQARAQVQTFVSHAPSLADILAALRKAR